MSAEYSARDRRIGRCGPSDFHFREMTVFYRNQQMVSWREWTTQDNVNMLPWSLR